jgi:flagellar assembly factor FliW
MFVHSLQLGDLEVDDKELYHMPHGMPGFPEEKTFILLPHGADSPFWFWQSTVTAALTFIFLDTFQLFHDYEFELSTEHAEELKMSDTVRPRVFSVVTLPKKIEAMTANLAAPVVLNDRDHLAMQVILEKTKYAVKHVLVPSQADKPASEGGK